MRRRTMLGALLTLPFAGACGGSDDPVAPQASRSPGTAGSQDPTASSAPGTVPAPDFSESTAALRRLEKRSGVRLGLFAADPTTGLSLGHRQDERFAMCSTFKAYAAAAVLKAHPLHTGFLEEKVRFTRADLIPNSPVSETRVDTGMTVAELCHAALTRSDNTAANELLDLLGGPSAVTGFARSLGDPTTRLDDPEPAMNHVEPGTVENTTTPAGMGTGFQALLLGEALPSPERERLTRWMKANRTGDARIRAGLPDGWTAADKTGTGYYGAVNDVAVVWSPDGRPLVVSVFSDKKTRDASYDEKAIAEATKIAVKALTAASRRP